MILLFALQIVLLFSLFKLNYIFNNKNCVNLYFYILQKFDEFKVDIFASVVVGDINNIIQLQDDGIEKNCPGHGGKCKREAYFISLYII